MTQRRFVWFDLMSTNPEASLRFHTELLGWEVTVRDMGGYDYPMFSGSGHGIGGLVTLDPGAGIPSHWVAYLECGDVDGTVERVKALGGQGCVPPTDIPGVGRFAVVEDPQSAIFSPFASHHGDSPIPAQAKVGQVCWSELMTPDVNHAAAFYSALCGWDSDHAEMLMGDEVVHYRVMSHRGSRFAGIMPMPEGTNARPLWMNYIKVEDVDDVAARAQVLDGKVHISPRHLPSVGRFAMLSDPAGAVLSVCSPG